MNKTLINAMIDNYVNRYDIYNNEVRQERLKWSAAVQFRQYWNIDSDDFKSMWQKATKHAFLGTRHGNPSGGISQLLQKPNEVEGVRAAFRDLFAEDHGDLDSRQDRIEAFMDYINKRLVEAGFGSFNKQTKDAVISYLNLYAPNDNYRFKAEPAAIWADFLDIADWGRGRYFSLKQYYRMCDEIRGCVSQHEGLLEIQRKHFSAEELEIDKEYHILAFDVLYCAWDSVGYMTQIKSKTIADEKESMCSEIRMKISQAQGEIEELQDDVSIDLNGQIVFHKSFGEGIIKSDDDVRILVAFPNGDKPFRKDDILKGKWLELKDQEVRAAIQDCVNAQEKITAIENELQMLRLELKYRMTASK